MRVALNLRAFAIARTFRATGPGRLTLWRTILWVTLTSPLCTKMVRYPTYSGAGAKWFSGPCPWPSRGLVRMASVTYCLARATAIGSGMPLASPAVMAAEYVQPVPCVFGVSMRFDENSWNWPSESKSRSIAGPSRCPPLIRTLRPYRAACERHPSFDRASRLRSLSERRPREGWESAGAPGGAGARSMRPARRQRSAACHAC